MAAFIQGTSSSQSGASQTTAQAFGSNVTQGNTLWCFVEWNPTGAVASGNLDSMTDTMLNIWTKLDGTQLGDFNYTGGPGCELWWAIAKSSGPCTVTAHNAFSYVNRRILVAEYSSIGMASGTPADAIAGGVGHGVSFTTANLTTLTAGDCLLLFACSDSANVPAVPTGYASRVAGSGIVLYDKLAAQPIGTYSASSAITACDWNSFLVGSFPLAAAWLGQGDTAGEWMDSNGIYTGVNPGVAQASGHFLDGGYKGLTWMKNVFMLPRDYWQRSLSTPYSGQIFPTGGNSGGPGQVYPF